jgi:hypothetical protein
VVWWGLGAVRGGLPRYCRSGLESRSPRASFPRCTQGDSMRGARNVGSIIKLSDQTVGIRFRVVAKPDLEATWYPLIGKDAAEELRRGRKISILCIPSGLFAGAAGLLIGTGTLNDIIGVALVAIGASPIVMFIRAQKRIAAAMTEWYGVKIKGLPKMNTKRFDDWREKRGLRHCRYGHDTAGLRRPIHQQRHRTDLHASQNLRPNNGTVLERRPARRLHASTVQLRCRWPCELHGPDWPMQHRPPVGAETSTILPSVLRFCLAVVMWCGLTAVGTECQRRSEILAWAWASAHVTACSSRRRSRMARRPNSTYSCLEWATPASSSRSLGEVYQDAQGLRSAGDRYTTIGVSLPLIARI